jgi:hypothetical protein
MKWLVLLPAAFVAATSYAQTQTCTPQNPPREGRGVQVFSDCTRFEGTWLNGQLHGPGKKQWARGDAFEGTFVNGAITGPDGVRVWADGRRYRGNFYNNQPAGRGELTLPDGTVYTGKFWGPTLIGVGIRRSPNGESLVGEWRENLQPFGEMLLVRPDGTRERVTMGAIANAPQSAAPPTAPPNTSAEDVPPRRTATPPSGAAGDGRRIADDISRQAQELFRLFGR